jgi:hypothetical protein
MQFKRISNSDSALVKRSVPTLELVLSSSAVRLCYSAQSDNETMRTCCTPTSAMAVHDCTCTCSTDRTCSPLVAAAPTTATAVGRSLECDCICSSVARTRKKSSEQRSNERLNSSPSPASDSIRRPFHWAHSSHSSSLRSSNSSILSSSTFSPSTISASVSNFFSPLTSSSSSYSPSSKSSHLSSVVKSHSSHFRFWITQLLLTFYLITLTASSNAQSNAIQLRFSIEENLSPNQLIGRIIDSEQSNRVLQPPFLIVPGAGGCGHRIDIDLSIDQHGGEIRSARSLDREQCALYEFSAIPQHGPNVHVTIHVQDANDNPPVFPVQHVQLAFPENARPREVKRALPPARDLDLGKHNRFVLLSQSNRSFAIDV